MLIDLVSSLVSLKAIISLSQYFLSFLPSFLPSLSNRPSQYFEKDFCTKFHLPNFLTFMFQITVLDIITQLFC